MTAFSICLLLFVANLLAYQSAAILLPVTGSMMLFTGLRFWLLRRRPRKPMRQASPGACPGTGCTNAGHPFRGFGVPPSKAQRKGLSLAHSNAERSQDKKRQKKGDEEPASVSRQGNVLYASFPSTKEGREKAIEAFNRESGDNGGDSEGRPLQ